MKTFEVMALGEDFELLSLLRYTNLQWNRKYNESGTFSIEIPFEQYDPGFCYIYTKDRPELGVIQQINYIDKGQRTVNLSGYFLEEQLNKRIAYQYATETNITNQPAWVVQTGAAEDVALAFFNGFKDVRFSGGEALLDIKAEPSQGRGHLAEHTRNNERLGAKIRAILKPSGLSYRVAYDFITNEKKLAIWGGIDRTQDNAELNNPVVFSTRYGNIKKADVLLSSANYRNGFLVLNSYKENDVDKTTIEAEISQQDGENALAFISSGANRSDFTSKADYISAMLAEGREQLQQFSKTISLQFSAVPGSYEYREDFDLGDLCSIELPEIGLSADARLVGCYEVIKKGVASLTMDFDAPEIIKGGIK